jgi:hypothetical protein
MELEHLYHSASGLSLFDCSWLGQRFDKARGFSPYLSESWVMRFGPDETPDGMHQQHVDYGIQGWFTMLWRAPSGNTYVADANNRVIVARDAEQKVWDFYPLPFIVSGIWGLDDNAVFAWGVDGTAPRLFRWDGAAWTEMPSPGDIMRMHGLALDRIYAVGNDGLLARWDGTTWHRATVPTKGVLTGIRVVGAEECWASGQDGSLYTETATGWREHARAALPLHDVASFAGDVWVAGGSLGLMRVVPGTQELEVVKPNIEALSLDARGCLLATASNLIAGTTDGKVFRAAGIGKLAEMTASRKPRWVK